MEFLKEELMAVLGVLGVVISVLWKKMQNKEKIAHEERVEFRKEQVERLKKSEELNQDSNKQVVEITGKYKYLEGRIDGVENLSKSVLKAINEATNGHKSSDDS